MQSITYREAASKRHCLKYKVLLKEDNTFEI